MSRSGVGLAAECVPLFEKLKARNLKYVIYRLSDDKKTIIKEKTSDEDGQLPGDEEGKYAKFLENLPERDCRYAVYDLEYEIADGKRSKIVFYTWSPDEAPVRSKMVYASSKDGLRRALAGVHKEVQGTDFSEVSYEEVLEKSKGR